MSCTPDNQFRNGLLGRAGGSCFSPATFPAAARRVAEALRLTAARLSATAHLIWQAPFLFGCEQFRESHRSDRSQYGRLSKHSVQ
jgi:hypothetical protein